MPSRLRRLLDNRAVLVSRTSIAPDGRLLRYKTADNEVANVIPMVSRLLQRDKSVKRAFICSSDVSQIFKTPGEGGFCGYRNIQMLISYIRGSKTTGHEHFLRRIPTIFQLQDLIERAWDMGFNSSGRAETGGISGTRKYIGTPEVSLLYCVQLTHTCLTMHKGTSTLYEPWGPVSL